MEQLLVPLANQMIAVKVWLHDRLGMDDEALHVHLSLVILFTAAVILRRRPDSIWCWLVVFVIEMANEYADIIGDAAGEGTLSSGLADLYGTMFWPTVILLFGRFLFPPRQEAKEVTEQLEEASESEE